MRPQSSRPCVKAGDLRQQEPQVIWAAPHAALPVLQRAGGDTITGGKGHLRQAGVLTDVPDRQVGGVPEMRQQVDAVCGYVCVWCIAPDGGQRPVGDKSVSVWRSDGVAE
nr:MAG TPA: hypothetical protein [Caudoviricetes sp.]